MAEFRLQANLCAKPAIRVACMRAVKPFRRELR